MPQRVKPLTRERVRFGVAFGWSLGRYEILRVATVPGADEALDECRTRLNICLRDRALSADLLDLPFPILFETVLKAYKTGEPALYDAILAGTGAFRLQLTSVENDERVVEYREAARSCFAQMGTLLVAVPSLFYEACAEALPSTVDEVIDIMEEHQA